MPDYGNPIRFGTFITPVNAPPTRPVELAVLSEELGYDLVTFQDHPYQPRFHDTWTLLTWVGAATERVELAANVHNLPLRQPAVLARSAASLDLLTGGRFAMGLGAGAFWDAIDAMGGPRLTPGESVTALTEAIEIMRGIWDADNRTPLRVDGTQHRVAGAKRGPAPAHPIPIWIGALKPRGLRLIGRRADGWLPSLGRMQPEDFEASNAIIDAAADRAGRNPGHIVRLGNIGADMSADALTELALKHGFSTFIVASDDPDALRRFALETAPAVRERVTAGRD